MNKIDRISSDRRQLGRPRGSCNKVSALLKDAILMAGDEADPEGLVGYLRHQAIANPVAFMALLGMVLPLQLTGQGSGPLEVRWLPPQEPPPERLFSLGRPARKGVRSPVAAEVDWGCLPSPDPLTAVSDSLMTLEGEATGETTSG